MFNASRSGSPEGKPAHRYGRRPFATAATPSDDVPQVERRSLPLMSSPRKTCAGAAGIARLVEARKLRHPLRRRDGMRRAFAQPAPISPFRAILNAAISPPRCSGITVASCMSGLHPCRAATARGQQRDDTTDRHLPKLRRPAHRPDTCPHGGTGGGFASRGCRRSGVRSPAARTQ